MKKSPEADAQHLLWRVQAIATGCAPSVDAVAPDGPSDPTTPDKAVVAAQGVDSCPPTKRPPQLRVPTTRQAYTWWDPKYWSIARPTDFCYGDAAWGLANQPVPLSPIEWISALLRREELEYTLPEDSEVYAAAKINRFRCSWQVLHILHSFLRLTETSNNIHTCQDAWNVRVCPAHAALDTGDHTTGNARFA